MQDEFRTLTPNGPLTDSHKFEKAGGSSGHFVAPAKDAGAGGAATPRAGFSYWNRRSTFWSDWDASDRATEESC